MRIRNKADFDAFIRQAGTQAEELEDYLQTLRKIHDLVRKAMPQPEYDDYVNSAIREAKQMGELMALVILLDKAGLVDLPKERVQDWLVTHLQVLAK